jgi:hypothetical protein
VEIPACAPAAWKKLYDAAEHFRDIECWDWMSDTDVFGVQNPDDGNNGYCCVLGGLREVYGLVVYLGSVGLEQHQKIQSGKLHPGSPNFAYSQSCLTAWFGDRRDLDDIDLKVIKDLGLKFREKNTWPQFRSMRPGYWPWYLAESEATFLTLCLEQARQVALALKKDPQWLDPPGKNLYRIRIREETSTANSPNLAGVTDEPLLFSEPGSEASRWKDQWLRPAPRQKVEVKPFPIDDIRLQRIKKICREHNGVWEIDGFFTPHPVAGDRRPFFPYTFLSADHDSGFLFSTALAEPSSWQTDFPEAFLQSVEEHGFLPNKLCVRKVELGDLFEPLAARLGIQLDVTKKLPAVDRAKRALLKFMERER